MSCDATSTVKTNPKQKLPKKANPDGVNKVPFVGPGRDHRVDNFLAVDDGLARLAQVHQWFAKTNDGAN